MLRTRIAPLALAAMLLAGCQIDLYSDLSEHEANEILAVLIRGGIDAERVSVDGKLHTVTVDEARLADAVDLLKANGYPKQRYSTMADVFAGDSLIQSPTEERARYVFALGEELSRTLSDIDGVLSARVHVVLPKTDPLRDESTLSSASVFIRYERRAQVNKLLTQIKMLVANSIDDLTYDKVAVIFVPVDEPRRETRSTDVGAAPSSAPEPKPAMRSSALLPIGVANAANLAPRKVEAAPQGGGWISGGLFAGVVLVIAALLFGFWAGRQRHVPAVASDAPGDA